MSTPVSSTDQLLQWASFWPNMTAPVAAGSAIVPTFYGFAVKSAQQTERPLPRMTPYQAFVKGMSAAPTVGAIMGLQTYVQKKVVEYVHQYFGQEQNAQASPELLAASSIFAGAVSSPLYAILNGQSNNQRPLDSLRSLTFPQGAAITVREGAFFGGLTMAESVSDLAKRRFGKTKTVEYVSAFASGLIGTFLGHPADTALTRWQQGMTADLFRTAFRGAPTRTLAGGLFSVAYKFVKDKLS